MPKKEKRGEKAGKKEKDGAKKAKRDADIKTMSEANSKLWETRLTLAEQSKQEYRDTARKLLLENEVMHKQIHRSEKDTIDVISYLKHQDQQKDRKIEELQSIITDLKNEHRQSTDRLKSDFEQKIHDLEQKVKNRDGNIAIMQDELKELKEFRRKRAQIQKELEEIKETMYESTRQNTMTIQRMEDKFFEEKMRLQEETDRRISELAERAQAEAIANLSETTKSVYKDNVRLTEALTMHTDEENRLKRIKERLEKENDELKGDNELNEMMIQDKVQKHRNYKQLVKDMQEKIDTLETALNHVVREFETERKAIAERACNESESTTMEVKRLQRVLELKTKEVNKIKRLARNILDQRTEMERFFLDSLEHVKMEIAANRSQYRKDAQTAYHRRMLAAHAGQTDYPKIRTFNKTDTSTNSVFKDLEAAERLIDTSSKVDISDLTWEQKERVLRYLFAKLNGLSTKRVSKIPALGHTDNTVTEQHEQTWKLKESQNTDDKTFITQANVEQTGTFEHLPKISSQTTQPEAQPAS